MLTKLAQLEEIQTGASFDFKDLFMSFDTIFWDIILGWYHDIFGWKFIMIFNWEEKTCLGPIRKFVYLIFITNFRNIIPKLTSQIIVPKDMNKSYLNIVFLVKISLASPEHHLLLQ